LHARKQPKVVIANAHAQFVKNAHCAAAAA
jgi:hypothetical protein